MKSKKVLLAALAGLTIPAAAMANVPQVGYAYAQIYQANSTVTLANVSRTGGPVESRLVGLKCIFPSNDDGALVKVEITADAGTTREQDLSITVDPTFFQQESNGAGQLLSGWVPLNVDFASTLLVQLNNTNLGTATINCWVSYWTSIVPE
jgi:hypothetical protein